MHALIERQTTASSIAILPVTAASLSGVLQQLETSQKTWINANDFRAEVGSVCLLPKPDGSLHAVLIGVANTADIYALAALPRRLPAGIYHLDNAGEVALDPQRAALGWALGVYHFGRYKKPARAAAELAVDAATLAAVQPLLDGIYHTRDLINTPTEDLGPVELAAAVQTLAQTHGADYRDWIGDALLDANFPAIHAVGRASHRAPRLAELRWGNNAAPHLVLIGKGVCFDTGGLDIKPADGMRWMKKDMGGAAHAIALAGLVMAAKLPVRLTLLIPAVENSIAGNAYRPGEVIRTRSGVTVEIDNTDAEGRVILGDALSYAVEQSPDLILDFATLTGAARIALGPELPVLFSNRDDIADGLLASSREVSDPLWRLPLWQPYRSMLDSSIADMANAGASRHAGAITAALYLQRFVPETQAWSHLDVYSWNDADRPGRPKGGEAQGLRAYFDFLQKRYSSE
ncbi:leucyl aminopeptidase family protein [Pseudolysobacter antarcticus]|uniref:Leucyl aminopeptidase family protein n=1 Tax=Pseudolysobacter antarcticus TaxID=2511995 RepID=A0A411HFL8_9GAMM|nr:leucyl aminopeptidase family protein [Pseudolysobacter antarcticus]QBB69270.1 leucyl aminopeptidase family protein [Pseudolysobacter antarcticus]